MHVLLNGKGAGEIRDYIKHSPNLLQPTEQQLMMEETGTL